jgi:hypothetical protein
VLSGFEHRLEFRALGLAQLKALSQSRGVYCPLSLPAA